MFTEEFEKIAAFGSADQANGDYQPKLTRDDKRATYDHDVRDLPTSKTQTKYKKTKPKEKKEDDQNAAKASNGETRKSHVSEEYPDFPGDRKEGLVGNIYNQSSVL